MSSLNAQVGELHGVIQVTRKDTGKVETYNIVGKVNHEQAEALGLNQPKQEKEDDSRTQHHGA